MNRRKPNGRAREPAAPPVAPVRETARTPTRARPGLRAWREQHAQSFYSSLGRLAARPWASTLTLLVMSLALTLPLLLWLLLDNARALGGNLDDARAISVFLKTDLNAAAAQAFAVSLRSRGDVAQVVLKTPEQGLQEFRNQSGFADALKVLQTNPLPTVLIVTPKVDALAKNAPPPLVAELERDVGVDLVQYDALWRQRLDAILEFSTRAAAELAILLALAALLVVGNTVRLDILSRADEITVVQLLGANNAFVRRPFLYSGLCYGVVSGLLALLTIGIVEIALARPLGQLTASYDHRFAVHGLSGGQALALIATSAVLGWLGAWLATTRHLALGQPQ